MNKYKLLFVQRGNKRNLFAIVKFALLFSNKASTCQGWQKLFRIARSRLVIILKL